MREERAQHQGFHQVQHRVQVRKHQQSVRLPLARCVRVCRRRARRFLVGGGEGGIGSDGGGGGVIIVCITPATGAQTQPAHQVAVHSGAAVSAQHGGAAAQRRSGSAGTYTSASSLPDAGSPCASGWRCSSEACRCCLWSSTSAGWQHTRRRYCRHCSGDSRTATGTCVTASAASAVLSAAPPSSVEAAAATPAAAACCASVAAQPLRTNSVYSSACVPRALSLCRGGMCARDSTPAVG